MNNLTNKRVLLGVTGGIAAYKSCDLVRRLRENGAEVRVVMTDAACEFVTPLSFQAISGNPVYRSLLDESAEAAMGHIELARWADVILIAPVSANFMAKLANGQADDLLSTLVLAASAPVFLAPSMNQQMWLDTATQTNVERLNTLGFTLLGPDEGSQACGDVGPGRMLEPLEICRAVDASFSSGLLSGHHVVITAGPTREAIDPVRYLSNRSSGKMGYAIAKAAVEAGAKVTLISGPTALEQPERVSYVEIESAGEMYTAVMEVIDTSSIFISAAAVADYTLGEIADHKIKKATDDLTLTLSKTADILAAVSARHSTPFTVGFAAETQKLEQNAKAKLATKQLDMIAANQVGNGLAFDSDDNALQIYWKNGQQDLPKAAKDKLARQLVELIAVRVEEK